MTDIITNMAIRWEYNDGGRAAAGFKGSAGDCAVRAVAITTGLAYKEIYDRINDLAKRERTGKRKRTVSNARTGVHRVTMHRLLDEMGAAWVPTMGIGTGCTVHVAQNELPSSGRLILNLSRHFAAVIDGVLHDTHDCSRAGTRCVYGYWMLEAPND
jgi:hypothetical protein